ncbi:MAG: fused MFS/spermidine synthase [Deltaproteobacteria bacterium]|nr:fused MFS/spermidine synthase [Deltaproteobacteria bacterium]
MVPSGAVPSFTVRVALLLFCSGLCALVYQVAWLRELRLVFGASTPASAAVLAVFMGGLGYGSLVLSKRAERVARPLLFYAKLEAGIAVSAAVTPLLLLGARAIYVSLGGTLALGMVVGTVVRLLLSAVVLLPPTLLMGGTLPAAARAAMPSGDVGRRSTALLYGANALGAVAGAGLSTFVLLEVFGTRFTLWIACLINLLVAVSARVVDRRLPANQPTAAPEPSAPSAAAAGDRPAAAPTPVPFVLLAAGVTGFVFLLLELVWYRMLSPLLGGSTYTFGLILAVALLGIGLGGMAYTFRRPDAEPRLSHFASTCGLEALLVAIPFVLGDRLALLTLLLRGFSIVGLVGQLAAWTVITAIVVLPAAVVAGYQFPLLIALLGKGSRQVSRHVGLAYASNTLGAIVGSLAGGFILMPLLTAPGLWKLGVWVLALLGSGAAVLHWSARKAVAARPRRWPPGVPLLTSLMALVWLHAAWGPTAVWRHSPIGAGRADHVLRERTQNSLRRWFHHQRAAVAWEVDGRESSIALATSNDTSFVISGKSDGAAVDDSATQVMGGLLGALLHQDVDRALVIGLGTGSTAGWLGALPAVQQVDVVEIEPAIVEVARACAPVNHGVLDNRKVQLIVADAREVLLTTRERYDLIISEPSNPYRAGIASLFTREFYEAVASRLEPGGVFIQWVQAYEIDVQSVRIVYGTLATVFPSVESWRADPGDLLLISSAAAKPFDAEQVAGSITQAPYREALLGAWRVTSVEGVLAHYVAQPSFARAVADQAGAYAVNTDDRNLLEFGVTRSLGRPNDFEVERLRRLAVERGEGRPQVVKGTVDWQRVDDRYVELGMASSASPKPFALPRMPPERQRRFDAMGAWVAGKPRVVVQAWQAQPRAPESVIELMVLADAHAALGHEDETLALLDQLRPWLPVEASAITARLAMRLGQRERAFEALRKAFLAYRSNPWPSNALMGRSLALARQLARAEPRFVDPLFTLLGEPFSVESLRFGRSAVRLDIAMLGDDPQRCALALAAFEPNPLWTEDFLTKRALCYLRLGHTRAERARDDLVDYHRGQGLQVDTDLAPPAARRPAPPAF